jgi:5'-3' exonuclease
MGIPKFARFLTTRYPLILKLIQDESDIPTIGNLYQQTNNITNLN